MPTVTEATATAFPTSLEVTMAGRRRVLHPSGAVTHVGRSAEGNTLVASSPFTSRRHGTITYHTEQGWVYADLGSTYGSYIADQRVTQVRITPGMVIHLGGPAGEPLYFGAPHPTPAPGTAPDPVTRQQPAPRWSPTPETHNTTGNHAGTISPDGRYVYTGTEWVVRDQGEEPRDERRQRPVDNSFAWALALAPLAFTALDVFLLDAAPQEAILVGVLAALAINTVLVVLDSRRLRESGVKVNAIWGILIVPVYLWQRSARARQSYTIPLLWSAAFILSAAAPAVIANTVGVQMDTGIVANEIREGIGAQAGVSVDVDCPDTAAAKPGSSFQCLATAFDGSSAIVDVHVQNTNGEFIWQVR